MKRMILALLVVMLGLGVIAALSAATYFPIMYRAPSTPTQTITPSPTATPIPGPILLPNGDFEQDDAIWQQYSNHAFDLIRNTGQLPITPHNGQWAAWMGGTIYDVDKLSQTVLVPPDHPYLSFWLWIQSIDDCNDDFAYIHVGYVQIDKHDLCYDHNTNGWAQKFYDLSAYSGQTVDIILSVETNGTLISSIYWDDFEFQTSLAP